MTIEYLVAIKFLKGAIISNFCNLAIMFDMLKLQNDKPDPMGFFQVPKLCSNLQVLEFIPISQFT